MYLVSECTQCTARSTTQAPRVPITSLAEEKVLNMGMVSNEMTVKEKKEKKSIEDLKRFQKIRGIGRQKVVRKLLTVVLVVNLPCRHDEGGST